MKQLGYFKDKTQRCKLQFEMVLAQPGASRATITNDSLRLSAMTEVCFDENDRGIISGSRIRVTCDRTVAADCSLASKMGAEIG
jgi:hypothetical protein